MTDRYAVFGNPIAHSKSPRIHALFAAQTGIALEYSALLSEPEEFAQDVMMFLISEGKGCNVTVPFKQEAWELADELSDYAARAQAVNTLVFREDGSMFGANTDGIGIVRDLQQNHGLVLQGKRILLLGAGGAVRGVLQPLLETQPASAFDVVFLDPPFNQNLLPTVCALLEERQWLADDAWVYTESETAPSTLGLPGNWRLHREQKSGRVYYALWQRTVQTAD